MAYVKFHLVIDQLKHDQKHCKGDVKNIEKFSQSFQSLNKRASSGYESGHENTVVGVQSPNSRTVVMSPYAKITKPKPSKNSAGSSGHGSDSGNSEVGKICILEFEIFISCSEF